MRQGLYFVAVAFGVLLIVVNMKEHDWPGLGFSLMWTINALGGFIAATAAFGLLYCALAGLPAIRQNDFVLPLLGGLVLFAAHWASLVVFAIVVLAMIGRNLLRRPSEPGS